MQVVIVGASGYIGSQLVRAFELSGDQVRKVSHLQISSATLCGAEVVINLSGATVARRWTKSYMQRIYGSRVSTTSRLVSIINVMPRKPRLFINASAVGVYDTGGIYNESEEYLGHDFLAGVCKDWEAEACKVSPEVRLVLMRLGAVMSRDGGVLERVIKNTRRLGVAVEVGNGRVYLPWISMHDLIRAIGFVIDNEKASGIVNMVSPKAVMQGEMARIVGLMCGVRRVLRIPVWILKLLIGRGASVLLDTRRVLPEKLLTLGFEFDHTDISQL